MIRRIPTHSLLFLLTLLLATTPAAAADPAETLVVANKSEATVSLLDLDTGEVVATLPTGEGPHEVAVSPDGKRAVITDYGRRGAPGSSLTLIRIDQPQVVNTIDLGEYQRPHGVLWLDDERVVITAEAQQALLVVNVESGEVEQAIGTAQEVSHMVALDDGKTRAYVANIGSGSLTVIDLAKGERIANVETGEGAEGVAVASGHVWVTNRAEDTITVLDAGTLEEVAKIESKGFPIRARATPDGEWILVTRARAGDLAIYDADNPEAEPRIVELGMELKDTEDRLFGDRFGDSSVPIGVVPDLDGSRAWIAHANADAVSEHDLETGEKLRVLEAGREPDGMDVSAVEAQQPMP